MSFSQTLGLAALTCLTSLLAVGAAQEAGVSRTRTRPARMLRPLDSQAALERRRERCSVDAETLGLLGVSRGQQIRVYRTPGEFAVFTVAESVAERQPGTVRTGRAGRLRLGNAGEFRVDVRARVVPTALDEATARRRGELIERLVDDGRNAGLLALAPHGGEVEPGTDAQALRVAERLGPSRASAWACQGYHPEGGRVAFERWHITSTDIHEASYPSLGVVARRVFAHAVSFHGHGAPNVLIGGGAPVELRRALAREVRRALNGSGIAVDVAGDSDALNGDDPRNVVNRYCRGTGIQIEQSGPARRAHGRAIADAVADFYVARLEPAR